MENVNRRYCHDTFSTKHRRLSNRSVPIQGSCGGICWRSFSFAMACAPPPLPTSLRSLKWKRTFTATPMPKTGPGRCGAADRPHSCAPATGCLPVGSRRSPTPNRSTIAAGCSSRESNGWTRVRVDADGRTREPSPLAAFADGRLFLSVNPTLGKGPEPNGGPARPDVLQFNATEPTAAPCIAGTSMARQAGVHGTFLQNVRRRRCARGTAPLSEHRLHARRMDLSRQCRQVERSGPAQVALGYRACQARPHPRLLSQRGAPRSRGALRRGERRARAQPSLAQVQARVDRPASGTTISGGCFTPGRPTSRSNRSPSGSRSPAEKRPVVTFSRATSGSRRTATLI